MTDKSYADWLRIEANALCASDPSRSRRLHDIADAVARMEMWCDSVVEDARQEAQEHVRQTAVIARLRPPLVLMQGGRQ